MREHDFEPVPGLPDKLPQGETLLWQGSPSWLGVASRALGIRLVGIYFVGLLVWREASVIMDGGDLQAVLAASIIPIVMGAVALSILAGLAWFAAWGTVYTITNRRVVMRFGIAFPGAINLPFSHIDAANMWCHRDGTGDIALKLGPKGRVGWLVMWPNVRMGSFARPEPMLRAVEEPHRVACLLGDALTAASPEPIAIRVPRIDQQDQSVEAAFVSHSPATV